MINIKREFEEKIFHLKSLLSIKDSSSSHSDCSSLEENELEEKAKAAKIEKHKKIKPEPVQERKDIFRN